jgi:IstB-like ATP binding protein
VLTDRRLRRSLPSKARAAPLGSSPGPPSSSSSAGCEGASLIVTSNKLFGRWGEGFGDDVVAAAMIDRLVHHADVVSLKVTVTDSRTRDLGRVPAATTEEQ